MTDIHIETERLVLRPPQAEDFAGWAAFFADPEATRYMGGTRGEPLAWRHFLMMAGVWNIQGYGAFSLLEKASGRWLGWSGPWHPPGWPGPEVGWCLARGAWGHGYATEAAAAIVDWVFQHLGWDDVVHLIAPDNRASQAVARKLGSTCRQRIDMPNPSLANAWMCGDRLARNGCNGGRHDVIVAARNTRRGHLGLAPPRP